MIKQSELTAGEGKYKVTLSLYGTGGRGLCCFLTGGERSHVGGVVLASLSERINSGGMTCNIWTIPLPGHKDTFAAEKLARFLCLATRQPISFTAGLHIDNATEEEIQLLMQNAEHAVRKYLQQINKTGG